jgi:beta-ribofuranosylaminobenzene 5'-phosphate synthase
MIAIDSLAVSSSCQPRRWMISSPARLHFGLTEICPGQPSLFAGCGMTIDEPSTKMSLERMALASNCPSEWSIDCGIPWKERIETAVKLASTSESTVGWKFVLRLDKPPLPHAGLGSGTQLACCVATLVESSRSGVQSEQPSVAVLRIWTGSDMPSDTSSNLKSLQRLAVASGRGARSNVGLGSHLYGGFIVDHGIQPNEKNGRAIDRYSIPESWRVLLVRPESSTTISGTIEKDYFRRCAVPNANRARMFELIHSDLVPAIQAQDLQRFGEALYEYGRFGGELFRAVQGGIYRDAAVTELVEFVRGLGVYATGQTSWGPTVYAIVAGQNEATKLEKSLRDRWGAKISTIVSRPSNEPSRVYLAESL